MRQNEDDEAECIAYVCKHQNAATEEWCTMQRIFFPACVLLFLSEKGERQRGVCIVAYTSVSSMFTGTE
jgi:hypothetical protein